MANPCGQAGRIKLPHVLHHCKKLELVGERNLVSLRDSNFRSLRSPTSSNFTRYADLLEISHKLRADVCSCDWFVRQPARKLAIEDTLTPFSGCLQIEHAAEVCHLLEEDRQVPIFRYATHYRPLLQGVQGGLSKEMLQ